MNRRDLLRFAAGGAVFLALPALPACTSSPEIGLRAWKGPAPDVADPRLRLLSWAVLAPNAHNTQPWKVDLSRPDEIDLYVDPSRVLPETDPPYRQIHISQGTFLEHLEIAARESGLAADIAWFPRGEYAPEVLADLPVATVRLAPRASVPRDALFAQFGRRHTNRRAYEEGRALSAAQRAALLASVPPDLGALALVESGPTRARLTAICDEAMRLEVSDPARNRETARWFRFSTSEIDEKRDGFGVEQGGISGFKRWFAESFLLSREKAEDPRGSFAESAITMARDGGRSASAFAILTCPGNTRLHQVKVGRAYARFALTASALGLAIQPMTQATQEYADMTKLKADLDALAGATAAAPVQMMIRVGFAEPVPHAPRRDARALLRGAS